MNKTALSLILSAILLILAQAVVFNNICLWGVAVPFVFLYVLLRLPLTMSKDWLFTIGFAIGLIIDIFSDTPGMNALACTLLMALRRPVLRLYVARDDELTDPYPSIRSLGFFTYAKYALSMSLLFCILIFLIEAFSLFGIGRLLLTIGASTLLTTILIVGIDSLISRKREKGL